VPHPLIPVLERLVETLQGALPETEVRQIRDLFDANQPELALEWIADAVSQGGLLDPSLHQLLLQLGMQLGINDSIRDRLGG
jgi:hypothetical protein